MTLAAYSNPTQDTNCAVLYRQTYNTLGSITAAGLTQNNTVGNNQKVNNTQLSSSTPLGILAGSVVAVAGDFSIGPCAGDSSTTYDKAVGIAVNNAVGNPYESSSAVSSGVVVYAHGTGTVLSTLVYETKNWAGNALGTAYAAGQYLYASQNGLLTNVSGLDNSSLTYSTLIGICLKAPSPTDLTMVVQLRI
jgi:hypothetical protein